MAWTYDQLITELESNYHDADQGYSDTVTYRALAWFDWFTGHDHDAIGNMLSAISAIIDFQVGIMAWGNYGYPNYGFALIDALHRSRACPFNGEIDMSDILNAMDGALPHQPILFVAYLEAYKASVWNATFDERYFAELVKRWAIWG